MGILNITPDSFSDGGDYDTTEKALARARRMLAENVSIIDIGAESTRPGSAPVSASEELKRLTPLLKALRQEAFPVPVSIDTRKAKVAQKAISLGASIINDVSALRDDPDMARVAASNGVKVVLMHMKGEPKNMQKRPFYRRLIPEIMAFFEERIDFALSAGIKEENIILDPGLGLGFGKTTQHNLAILQHLPSFKIFGRPLLVGPSRKNFIGEILNAPVPKDRVIGTMATVVYCALYGAAILRVHDVKETVEALKMTQAILG